jgi:hypothetical protein
MRLKMRVATTTSMMLSGMAKIRISTLVGSWRTQRRRGESWLLHKPNLSGMGLVGFLRVDLGGGFFVFLRSFWEKGCEPKGHHRCSPCTQKKLSNAGVSGSGIG